MLLPLSRLDLKNTLLKKLLKAKAFYLKSILPTKNLNFQFKVIILSVPCLLN